MTVNRTTLLDLPLPVTGTESGTWGDTTNNGLTQYLDIAIAGTLVLSTDADVTLTSTEGDSSATNIGATTAQYAILRWTATGSTTRNITALAQSKTYVVINATGGTQSIVLRGAGPTTGVTIISGEKALCVWNGSDFVKVSSSAAAGGSNTQVQYNSSGVLAGSSNMTFDGTSLTLGGNPTLSAGTANGVLYLNGSKVATSGSALTFDGTTLTAFTSPGTSNPLLVLKNNSAVSNSNIVEQQFYISNNNSGNDVIAKFGAINPSATGNNYGNFYWSLANAGAPSEQMRLTSTGLGIGTSSPATKLHIGGSTTPNLRFEQTNSSVVHQFQADSGNFLLNIDATNAIGGSNFFIQQTGSTKVTLDSSGNLGLGVTPSAANLGKALQITNASFVGYSNNAYVGANWYYGSGDKYIANGFASLYAQDSSVHKWYTAPSGTAGNAITFTQAMTLDASGQLGIGTTTPDIFGRFYTRSFGFSSSGSTVLQVNGGSGSYGGIDFGAGGTRYSTITGSSSDLQIGTVVANPILLVTNGTERARITSGGDLLVGKTTTGLVNTGIELSNLGWGQFTVSGDASLFTNRLGSDGDTVKFYRATSLVGSISVTASATAYNTSSDYRLKDNPQPLTGSGAFIDALKPKTWNWTTDGSKGVGFIAHEVQEVSPGSVVGTKDAVDADGKPVMQAMEYGSAEFIANIIAELQSLRQRVALLEGN